LVNSKWNGARFVPFSDITEDVEPGSTKLSGRATLSKIKTACATPGHETVIIPMVDTAHLVLFAALLLLGGSLLLARSRRQSG
jgi:hypothetical protein